MVTGHLYCKVTTYTKYSWQYRYLEYLEHSSCSTIMVSEHPSPSIMYLFVFHHFCWLLLLCSTVICPMTPSFNQHHQKESKNTWFKMQSSITDSLDILGENKMCLWNTTGPETAIFFKECDLDIWPWPCSWPWPLHQTCIDEMSCHTKYELIFI